MPSLVDSTGPRTVGERAREEPRRAGGWHHRPPGGCAIDRSDTAIDHPDIVTVYWRPGCGFCSGLLRALDRHGLPFARVNIWEDPDAAAFVRSVADGNETVPTVRVGEVAMVNPSSNDVLLAVSDQAPERLPEGWSPPEPGRLGKLVDRVLGG